MNTKRALLASVVACAITGAGGVPAAHAAYPFKCKDNQVLKVDRLTGATTNFTSINAAVVAAVGDPTGSGSGDTVIVCHGTFHENVIVPQTDAQGSNQNLTIRSGDDTNKAIVTGSAAGAVFDIDAPGVTLGGPGLGLTITGASTIGVQVGDPMEPDPDQDDDQPQPCPPEADLKCPDQEIPAFATTNVSIVGNRIVNLSGTDSRAGISVTNTNNTMTFRNLVENITSTDGDAYGIRYSDSNYNVEIHQNKVDRISQSGVACSGSTLASPTVGAIGVAVQEEALDASILDTIVEDVTSPCIAIGAYSDAYGGLENDRNGQQIPIVTDMVDNRIKRVSSSATGNSSAGVVISPNPLPSNDEDTNPPSAFRVLANDLDNTKVAIAVLMQMGQSSLIRENDLDADDIGVLNNGNQNLDATNNWWGCQEGPRIGANTKKACARIVNGSGTTVFNPWLKGHVDHAGAHAGEYAGHG
jgi:hypothetical protein